MLLTVIAAGVLLAAGRPAQAGMMHEPQALDEANGWNPDVAFDAEHGVYLAVWSGEGVCGRILDSDGKPVTGKFHIAASVCYNGYPAVAYNPEDDEFLVTWDNCSIYGQRVKSPTGVLEGSVFLISATPGERSAVAWGPGPDAESGCYLVLYSNWVDVYGQRVSRSGVLVGGELALGGYSYPAVSYSTSARTFLGTWDDGYGRIEARLIPLNHALPVGSSFLVTPEGVADRSHIARDDALGRWLVQYQDQSRMATQDYDQFARFVNDNGTLGPGPYPAADRPEFEGETNLGCDIAFASKAGVYFSVFGTNDGIFGQLLDHTGIKRRGRVDIGLGNYTLHSNAADPDRDRFLTVYSRDGGTLVYSRLYRLYAPVESLSAAAEPGRIRLTWTQPDDTDMTRAAIRFKTTGMPADPSDGALAADLEVTPGTSASYMHAPLDHRQTYYYAVFAHDPNPIYAPGVTASARPALPGDLDGDGDVDQEDFGRFQVCLSGTGQPHASECDSADLEGVGDGDVDPDDFEVFRACIAGAEQEPGC